MTQYPTSRPWRIAPSDLATVLSSLLAAAAGVVLLLSTSTTETTQSTPGGAAETIVRNEPVTSIGEGLPYLLAAIALAVLPLLARRTSHARMLRIAVAVIGMTFVVLAGLSVGLLYLPAAACAVVAACLSDDAA